MWIPYKRPRYTTNEWYIDQKFGIDMQELCKTCGYPYGTHFGNICPKKTDEHIGELKPQFIIERLNKNIKII